MVLLALAVERGGCEGSRCHGDSNDSLHVAVDKIEMTRVETDDRRQEPYLLYKRPIKPVKLRNDGTLEMFFMPPTGPAY